MANGDSTPGTNFTLFSPFTRATVVYVPDSPRVTLEASSTVTLHVAVRTSSSGQVVTTHFASVWVASSRPIMQLVSELMVSAVLPFITDFNT